MKEKIKAGANGSFEKVQIIDINDSLSPSTNSIVLKKLERKCTEQSAGCVTKAVRQ